MIKLLDIIKKGKGVFLHSILNNRYYDLKNNSNILGHSYKKLTTEVKNYISNSWNLNSNTIHHKRLLGFIQKNFGENYSLKSNFSLLEFFSRFMLYLMNKSLNIEVIGKRFNLWFENYFVYKNNMMKKNKIQIIDMAEFFLNSQGKDNKIKKKNNELLILNYYWYPEIDVNTMNADLIILPEIYNGNFNYVLLLINKESLIMKDSLSYSQEIFSIPSLYVASSLKMFHLIKKFSETKIFKINWEGFVQYDRLFSCINFDLNNIKKNSDTFYSKKILLNDNPPFYNYLPLNLEDYQIKYLTGLK